MPPPPRNNAKKDVDIEMDDINKNNDTSIRSSIRMVAEHHEEQIIHDAAAHDEVNGGKNESPNTTPILMTTTMDDAFHWQKYSDWATTAKEEGDDDDDDDDDTIENPVSYASSTAGHTAVVQSFMSGGGATHAKLVAEIQKRRKIQHQRSNNPGLGIVPHQEVSFEIVDTPIWHHYRNHGRSSSSRSRNVDGGLRKRRKNKEQQQKETNENDDDDVDDDEGDAKVASTVAAASEPQPTSVAASPSPHRQQQPAADTTNERTRRIRIKEKQWERRLRNIVRYMIVIAIGIAMSVVGFVISYSADHLNNVKLDFALRAATSQQDDDDDDDDDDTNVHDARVGFGIFVSINIILALVAFVPVVLRPHSAGSGIAEAKAVLNGLVLDKCTDLMTAACKGLSVVFAASASLPIGLEGPLIFIGLSVGEHACRLCLPTTTTTGGRRFSSLRTDRARRDFCAVGTASGVSAAFYAPIGGVLFALEEGASFWSQALMWQCFAAASVTLFVSYFWVACETRDFGTPIDFSNIG
jgi:Voltage gated chloride channel